MPSRKFTVTGQALRGHILKVCARWQRYERVRDREDREETKYARYCLEQCDLLRTLAELEAKERAMYMVVKAKS